MRSYLTDLHVHTVLSPCASVEMTPSLVVQMALELGLDIIAVTDHNAGDNAKAVWQAARQSSLTVWPGMEVECAEEAHLLVLFDDWPAFASWCAKVDGWRNGRLNQSRLFGPQWILSAEDELLGEREELLLSALTADAQTLCEEAVRLGGMVIASHVDRPAYSLLGQLGIWPTELPLAAAEISTCVASEAEARQRLPLLPQALPLVTASDAHSLAAFCQGSKVQIVMEKPTLAEFYLALHGKDGRWLRWHRL
nr:PHP domain-containing protein [uncultured Anaeromusa sp.]